MTRHKVTAKSFLSNWTSGKRYCGIRRSGCYVIRLYRPFRIRHSFWYVGQSVDVHDRIHQHLTGHGNADLYTHIHYLKERAVIIIHYCRPEQLNSLERHLIAKGHESKSFNRTKGGGRRR